jgi:hypothetical protein
MTRLAQNQQRAVLLTSGRCGLRELPGLQSKVTQRVSRFLDTV